MNLICNYLSTRVIVRGKAQVLFKLDTILLVIKKIFKKELKVENNLIKSKQINQTDLVIFL